MHTISRRLLPVLAVCAASPTIADIPRWESYPVGTTWVAGNFTVADGVQVVFFPLDHCDGTSTAFEAEVLAPNKCSTGHRLSLNNLNARFMFAVSSGPQNGAIMRFGESGGSKNIHINGSPIICFNGMMDLDGVTIGGVTVQVVLSPNGNGCGEARFSGIINDLIIGGQEFWIDGICIERSPDIDSNGVVDAADLAQLLGAWGSNVEYADFNCDEIIDAADLAYLLAAWT